LVIFHFTTKTWKLRRRPEWLAFQSKLAFFDGVLFVTPEYNRSVPAVLKTPLMPAPVRMVKAAGMANPAPW
jgi:hypothetical protein